MGNIFVSGSEAARGNVKAPQKILIQQYNGLASKSCDPFAWFQPIKLPDYGLPDPRLRVLITDDLYLNTARDINQNVFATCTGTWSLTWRVVCFGCPFAIISVICLIIFIMNASNYLECNAANGQCPLMADELIYGEWQYRNSNYQTDYGQPQDGYYNRFSSQVLLESPWLVTDWNSVAPTVGTNATSLRSVMATSGGKILTTMSDGKIVTNTNSDFTGSIGDDGILPPAQPTTEALRIDENKDKRQLAITVKNKRTLVYMRNYGGTCIAKHNVGSLDDCKKAAKLLSGVIEKEKVSEATATTTSSFVMVAVNQTTPSPGGGPPTTKSPTDFVDNLKIPEAFYNASLQDFLGDIKEWDADHLPAGCSIRLNISPYLHYNKYTLGGEGTVDLLPVCKADMILYPSLDAAGKFDPSNQNFPHGVPPGWVAVPNKDPQDNVILSTEQIGLLAVALKEREKIKNSDMIQTHLSPGYFSPGSDSYDWVNNTAEALRYVSYKNGPGGPPAQPTQTGDCCAWYCCPHDHGDNSNNHYNSINPNPPPGPSGLGVSAFQNKENQVSQTPRKDGSYSFYGLNWQVYAEKYNYGCVLMKEAEQDMQCESCHVLGVNDIAIEGNNEYINNYNCESTVVGKHTKHTAEWLAFGMFWIFMLVAAGVPCLVIVTARWWTATKTERILNERWNPNRTFKIEYDGDFKIRILVPGDLWEHLQANANLQENAAMNSGMMHGMGWGGSSNQVMYPGMLTRNHSMASNMMMDPSGGQTMMGIGQPMMPMQPMMQPGMQPMQTGIVQPMRYTTQVQANTVGSSSSGIDPPGMYPQGGSIVVGSVVKK